MLYIFDRGLIAADATWNIINATDDEKAVDSFTCHHWFAKFRSEHASSGDKH